MAIQFKVDKDVFKKASNWVGDLFKPKKQPLISPISEGLSPSLPTSTPTPEQTFGRVTYYLPTGNLTATGTTPVPDYTAAISRELKEKIPMGSIIELPDGSKYRIEDFTASKIKNTLDLFRKEPKKGEGLKTNVPFKIVGRDTTGLKYNF